MQVHPFTPSQSSASRPAPGRGEALPSASPVRAGMPSAWDIESLAAAGTEPPHGRARRGASCWSLAASMCKVLCVATLNGAHQFISQGIGTMGRALLQTGFAVAANRPPYGTAAAAITGEIVTLAGIGAAGSTAVRLAGGTIAALRGRTEPLDARRLPKISELLTVLAMAAAVAPGLLAWRRADQDGVNLGAELLALQAGRTVQNLLRDAFTQATRRALPTLRYSRQSDGQVLKPGTPQWQDAMLTRSVVLVRLGLTLASYATSIFLVSGLLQPYVEDTRDAPSPDFGVTTSARPFLESYAWSGLMSALIEGLDSFNTTLAIAVSAWCAGARASIAPAEGFDHMSASEWLGDVRDAVSVRLLNSVVTVDQERGYAELRGVDRTSGAGLAGAGLALMLTDLRGFTVEVGRHHRQLVAAIATAPPQAEQRMDSKHASVEFSDLLDVDAPFHHPHAAAADETTRSHGTATPSDGYRSDDSDGDMASLFT